MEILVFVFKINCNSLFSAEGGIGSEILLFLLLQHYQLLVLLRSKGAKFATSTDTMNAPHLQDTL